jgi:hypothetical protein
MSIQELVQQLQEQITAETYQQHKNLLDGLEHVITVENMAAADSAIAEGDFQ